jgi:large subunit ribosomal protein L13
MATHAKVLKTPLPVMGELKRQWFIVDAKNQVLGRLASHVAMIIRGKHKPTYTPFMDTGDFVIVINAKDVMLTGNKPLQKEHRWYTGYPGGLRKIDYRDLIKKDPIKVINHAVFGMLPHNILGRKLHKKLFVYAGSEHPHIAQKPEPIEL